MGDAEEAGAAEAEAAAVTTLHDLLATTMLRTATPSATLATGHPDAADAYHWWNYTDNFASGHASLSGVTCYSEQYSMAATVCDEITWGDVGVTTLGAGAQLALPLIDDYLIGYYSCPGGRIAESESHPLWRLQAEVEHGVMRVYAYDITGGNVGAVPEDFANSDLSDFLPERIQTPAQQRVIVAVSFLGCTPRADFEPGGVLKAARMYPHTYVLSNAALDQVACRITVKRPVNRMVMGGVMDDMTEKIGMVLIADRNVDELFLRPEWSFIFDYYDTYPATGRPFKAVDNSRAKERTNSYDRRVLGLNLGNPEYVAKTVLKVPRQGEFDNVHIAPRYADAGSMSDLTGTVMAPVCQHDCLHTHWRWGLTLTAKQARGWSSDGPYTKPGATLIPLNQELSVTLTEDRPGFHYDATANDVAAGALQVFNHHGSAYGIVVDSVPLQAMVTTSFGWRKFYRSLRYANIVDPATGEDRDYERVQLQGEHSMDALRRL
jgi:hypothetical protein